MKNPTLEVLEAAADALDSGTPFKTVLADSGLNYSQAWYFWRRRQVEAEGLAVEFSADAVKALRADASLSWGEIAVRCGVAESKVRRAWTEGTDLKSQGLRIGRGGRWYYGDRGAPLYEEELSATGTEIPKGATYDVAVTAAKGQRLVHLELDELKNLASDWGVSPKGTKAQIAQRIRKAMLKVPATAEA